MKKLITILLLVLTVISYGQTKLDMLVFKGINEYRVSHGVKPLIFDSLVWDDAEHHSAYLHEHGYPYDYPLSSGHYEMELELPSDRLAHFGVDWNGYSGECITYFAARDTDMENVAKVIDLWDSSPPHKKGMLSPEANKLAISLVGIPWEKTYSWTVNGKVSTYTMSGIEYIATLLVVR